MKLVIYTDERHLATLERRSGVCIIVDADLDYRTAIERRVLHGLDEIVDGEDGLMPRRTPSSDPTFLPRLRDFLHRSFISIRATLVTEPEEIDGLVVDPVIEQAVTDGEDHDRELL